MKRFVGNDLWAVPAITVLTVAIVAVTGTGASGTYVVAIGLLAILIGWRRVQESSPSADWRRPQ
jgi:hypothetical protein